MILFVVKAAAAGGALETIARSMAARHPEQMAARLGDSIKGSLLLGCPFAHVEDSNGGMNQ
jgi:hypothetical protein